MASYQVICIIKPNVNSSNEHITHIGYYDANFKKVTIKVADAIRRIDLNDKEFYVKKGNDIAYVKVVRPFGRDPHIKTVPDSTERDNLLSLDQCEI